MSTKQEIIATKSITPPPTKTEAIEALLQLKKQEFLKGKEAAKEKLKAIEAKIKAKCLKLAKKAIQESEFDTYYYAKSGANAKLTIIFKEDDVPELTEAFKESEKIRSYWDEKYERQEIRNALNGKVAGRVEAMLNTPEIRKKLEETAKAIGI